MNHIVVPEGYSFVMIGIDIVLFFEGEKVAENLFSSAEGWSFTPMQAEARSVVTRITDSIDRQIEIIGKQEKEREFNQQVENNKDLSRKLLERG